MTPPNYAVNHQLSVQLDSTNAFEGPEKLLEVWFAPTRESLPKGKSLRNVSRSIWEDMLDLVQCKVLSVMEEEERKDKDGGYVDAYLLSESSMFVFGHKLILKTCGTTTLLKGLGRILEIASTHVGFDSNPYLVFYSRRSFLFPDKQLEPHSSWDKEVDTLNHYFSNGSAYVAGKSNDDHWYFYTGGKHASFLQPPHVENDETLEILMTDLSVEKSKLFFTNRRPFTDECGDGISNNNNYDGQLLDTSQSKVTDPGHIMGSQITKESNIKNLYPDATIDSFAFSPCGYSANGLIGGDYYFTCHVTPEQGFSYASFETNAASVQNRADLIRQVIDIFEPHRFTVSYFEATTNNNNNNNKQVRLGDLPGYIRRERITYELAGYDLVFVDYTKSLS